MHAQKLIGERVVISTQWVSMAGLLGPHPELEEGDGLTFSCLGCQCGAVFPASAIELVYPNDFQERELYGANYTIRLKAIPE